MKIIIVMLNLLFFIIYIYMIHLDIDREIVHTVLDIIITKLKYSNMHQNKLRGINAN